MKIWIGLLIIIVFSILISYFVLNHRLDSSIFGAFCGCVAYLWLNKLNKEK